MANNIYLKEYQFTGEEQIIFDTNILMYLFSPFYQEGDYGYGKILENIIENNVKIFITDHIISEFINTTCRIAFKQYQDSFPDGKELDFKKDYRITSDYDLYFKLAKGIVIDDLLSTFKLLSVEDQEIISSLEQSVSDDYVDELIIHTAAKNNCGILTHDYDFRTINLPIDIFHLNSKNRNIKK